MREHFVFCCKINPIYGHMNAWWPFLSANKHNYLVQDITGLQTWISHECACLDVSVCVCAGILGSSNWVSFLGLRLPTTGIAIWSPFCSSLLKIGRHNNNKNKAKTTTTLDDCVSLPCKHLTKMLWSTIATINTFLHIIYELWIINNNKIGKRSMMQMKWMTPAPPQNIAHASANVALQSRKIRALIALACNFENNWIFLSILMHLL